MGLQSILGPLVAWYLFLAGVGAGAYLVGVVASLLGERYRLLVKPGIFLGAPVVATGTGLYLLNLGLPLRFYLSLFSIQTSILSIALQILTLFVLIGLIHIALLLLTRVKVNGRAMQLLGIVNGLLALGAVISTGMVLSIVRAVPFWNTPIIPLLFLISSLLSGIGAVLAVVDFWCWVKPETMDAQKETLTKSVNALSRVGVPFLVIELVVLGALFYVMTASESRAAESARYLLSGDFSKPFWFGVVIIGLVAPVILEVWSSTRKKTMGLTQRLDLGLIVGTCLLVGGLALRYAILAAGASVSGAL